MQGTQLRIELCVSRVQIRTFQLSVNYVKKHRLFWYLTKTDLLF